MRNQQAFMEKNVYKYGNGLKAHFVSANTEYIYIVTMRWSHKVWHCSFPFKHCLCTPNQMEMQLKPVHSEQPEEDEKRWKSLFFFLLCTKCARHGSHIKLKPNSETVQCALCTAKRVKEAKRKKE